MKKVMIVSLVAIVLAAVISAKIGYDHGYNQGREEVCVIRSVCYETEIQNP